MIEPSWRRIAGIHCQKDGEIGVVWLAHDKETDVIHVYDCCVFRREVLAVIVEGLNARARWIPIAWEAAGKDMADKLLDRGCNMICEATKDSETMAEVTSRDIWERMRTGRFKVSKRLGEWADEFESFSRRDAKIPRDSYLLMAATRHAVAMMEYAKRQSVKRRKDTNFPKVAIT